MRRFAVCGFVVLAAGLVLAPGALAAAGVRHIAPSGTRQAIPSGVDFRQLGDTTYDISGHVLNWDGSAAVGAEVDWGSWDGGIYTFGGTNMPSESSPGTDSSGYFAFPSVTSAPTANSDDLTVWYSGPSSSPLPASWPEKFETWTDDFATQADYTLQPGAVALNVANLGSEVDNGPADVWVSGVPGCTESGVDLTSGSGTAFAVPGSFSDVIVGFYNEWGAIPAAVQWQGDATVNAGDTSSTVSLDWTNAQSAALAGHLIQHSGKAGSVVKMELGNWAANQQATFYVRRPDTGKTWTLAQSYTSNGTDATVSLKIPTSAPVDLYEVHAARSDSAELYGMPDLMDIFQVCTFKSSASAIHHGKAVRLSGKIPGIGSVVIYSRHTSAGQPATLVASGWVKTATCKSRNGVFATGLLHPKRTTWYVAKYVGYDFKAFTSVVKVTVH